MNDWRARDLLVTDDPFDMETSWSPLGKMPVVQGHKAWPAALSEVMGRSVMQRSQPAMIQPVGEA